MVNDKSIQWAQTWTPGFVELTEYEWDAAADGFLAIEYGQLAGDKDNTQLLDK